MNSDRDLRQSIVREPEIGRSLALAISLREGLWVESVPESAKDVADRLAKVVEDFRPYPAQRPHLRYDEIVQVRFRHSSNNPPELKASKPYRDFLKECFGGNQVGPTFIDNGWVVEASTFTEAEWEQNKYTKDHISGMIEEHPLSLMSDNEIQQRLEVYEARFEAQEKDLVEKDQLIAKLQQDIRELQARVLEIGNSTPGKQESAILAPSLLDQQRAVLQAILDLPDDGFAEAARLMEPLVGQPMTQAFCNSFKAVLKKKSWGVTCPTCGRPSTVVWVTNSRNAEGGKAVFTHTGPSPHGSMARIHKLIYVRKLDRRIRSK